MTKNEKGITMMILVVTIIVILILAGVVMSINMNLNKTVELKEVIANMEIIKTAATPYRDKYIGDTVIIQQGTGDDREVIHQISKEFIGEYKHPKNSEINKLLSYAEMDTISDTAYYWFQLKKEDLEKLNVNIKTNNSNEDDLYFINYDSLEVAYCKDKKDDHGNYIGIKVRKRFNGTGGALREKYLYFYKDLKDVKTKEVRK